MTADTTRSRCTQLLVVDDEPAVREILSAMLSASGYEVTTVGIGSEAIRLLERRSFDLVLLDVHLPGLNGWDVLDRTRALPAPPPVLMISDERYEAEALRRGASFLAKPYRRAAVDDSVRRALGIEGCPGSCQGEG